MNKWDERFYSLAKLVASWSKDPSTQVGAVITDLANRLVSIGYNGFPRHIDDSPDKYEDRDYKYKVVIHAEENAILNTDADLKDCTLYLYPLKPCSHCAGHIIQKGIKNVVVFHSENNPDRDYGPTEDLFKQAGVKLTIHEV